jgi:hypothetical protein
MDLTPLTSPRGPWLHALTADLSDAWDALRRLERAAAGRVAGRVIRGPKARTTPALFDETAAALQFPPYFGENWDALHDCLTDLEWLAADGYVLLFTDAPRLLEAAPPLESERLVLVLQGAAGSWNAPEGGRPPRPFHAVFHAAPGQAAALRTRWQAAGAELNVLS